MTDALAPILRLLADGVCLTADQAEAAFEVILSGSSRDAQIGAMAMAMRVRGETVPEIVGAVRAMRARMTPVRVSGPAIDTCGTGGDGAHTLNISTAVAFVVAACGVAVAKHGNRAQSSRCGAADVLEALGVNLDTPAETVGQIVQDEMIGFLFATRHHAAMRHVAAVRRDLGVRTIFNLLGPLCNPANARRQLLGVFAPEWLAPLAQVLRAFGSERAWVVHGEDGLDELTTTTGSQVAELREDGSVHRFTVEPEQAGVARARASDLQGGDAEHNACALRALLRGATGPYRDIVVLNAAAALVVAGRSPGLRDGARRAGEAIDSGAAAARLEALVRATNMVPA